MFGREGTHSVPYIEQIIEPDGYCKNGAEHSNPGMNFPTEVICVSILW